MKKQTFSLEVGGKTLTAEFNDLADQADGSVMIRYGNTVVFTTAVMSEKEKPGDFFPLTVDYEEKFYAAGQILGSRFMRREGRPSDEAILSGRITDRTIRPLFDHSMRHEVQVVITILSIEEYEPDVLGVIGSSLGLGTSRIPWSGPVSAVRVCKLKEKDEFVINPTFKEKEAGVELELVVCGKDGKVNMIEIGAAEIGEALAMQAIALGMQEIEKIEQFQKKIIAEIGKTKRQMSIKIIPEEIKKVFAEKIQPNLETAVFSGAGHAGIDALHKEWKEAAAEAVTAEQLLYADEYFEEQINDIIHKEAVTNNRRPDGRTFDEVRPLFAQAGGISPVHHGAGIFYRGGTHVLSVLTLGGPGDSQIIDGMELQTKKRFMHHYNFPPFSSGEVGRVGSTNRRMIGHGALAEKALAPIIPAVELFPYTIRIVSESMASNGSTSMASVCASTLALMDAGVPIMAPVAGIASGLMMADEKNYKVLTDIQGPEDHHGDMDFKVAGTRTGITAVQMDVKVAGIPVTILSEAFDKAKAARLFILDEMKKAIDVPRPNLSANAPRILSLKIKPSQIGLVIGTGGKTINAIKEKTGAEIDIDDDGTVFITGKGDGAEEAKNIIEEMTHEYKPGERLEGTVVKLADFGAFVKIGQNTEGLVHISEMAPFRVQRVSDILKEGATVPVLVKGIDDRGKISLSIKSANPNFFQDPSRQSSGNGGAGANEHGRTE